MFPETTLQFWKEKFKLGLLFGTLLQGHKIAVETGGTSNPVFWRDLHESYIVFDINIESRNWIGETSNLYAVACPGFVSHWAPTARSPAHSPKPTNDMVVFFGNHLFRDIFLSTSNLSNSQNFEYLFYISLLWNICGKDTPVKGIFMPNFNFLK